MKPPPIISHLQAAALSSLADETSGRELRRKLALCGFKQSRPAFYRLMGRLEDMKFVGGEYVNTTVAGQIVRERRYCIRPAGTRALRDASLFYANLQSLEFNG